MFEKIKEFYSFDFLMKKRQQVAIHDRHTVKRQDGCNCYYWIAAQAQNQGRMFLGIYG